MLHVMITVTGTACIYLNQRSEKNWIVKHLSITKDVTSCNTKYVTITSKNIVTKIVIINSEMTLFLYLTRYLVPHLQKIGLRAVPIMKTEVLQP